MLAVVFVATMSYNFFIAWRGIYLIREDRSMLKVLGVAVAVVAMICLLVVQAALRFDVACQLVAYSRRKAGGSRELLAVPRLRSGRKDRRAAGAWLEQQHQAVRQAPQDWRAWFRLAQAYDLAGDRKGARAALRTAIERGKQPR